LSSIFVAASPRTEIVLEIGRQAVLKKSYAKKVAIAEFDARVHTISESQSAHRFRSARSDSFNESDRRNRCFYFGEKFPRHPSQSRGVSTFVQRQIVNLIDGDLLLLPKRFIKPTSSG